MEKIKLIKCDEMMIKKIFNQEEVGYQFSENGFDSKFLKKMGYKVNKDESNVYRFYLVQDLMDKLIIGIVSFKILHDGIVEITYMIDPEYRKKGLAKLAVKKALNHVRKDEYIEEIHAYVPKHHVGDKILKENDFKEFKESEEYMVWQLLNGFF